MSEPHFITKQLHDAILALQEKFGPELKGTGLEAKCNNIGCLHDPYVLDDPLTAYAVVSRANKLVDGDYPDSRADMVEIEHTMGGKPASLTTEDEHYTVINVEPE